MQRARRSWFMAVAALCLFALVLHAPALRAQYTIDDYVQRAMALGRYPAPRGFFDLYAFIRGNPTERQLLEEASLLPWWTTRNYHLVMFRPLSSALLMFDLRVLGGSERLAHVHSLFWLLLFVVASARFYRFVFGPVAAVCAVLWLLIDDSFVTALGWIANRCLLVSMLFAFLGLYHGFRWQALGRHHDAIKTILATVLALFSAEYSVAVLALLPLRSLLLQRMPSQRRIRSVAVSAVILVCYLLTRILWGAGVRGSGLYLDPLLDPGAFVRAVPERFVRLLGDLFLGISVDFPTQPAPVSLFFALVALTIAYRAVAPTASGRFRTTRLFLLGTFGVLLSVSGSWLSTRLLLAPAALLAPVLGAIFHGFLQEKSRRRWLAIPALWWILFAPLLYSPWNVRSVWNRQYAITTSLRNWSLQLFESIPEAVDGSPRDLVIVNAPDAESLFFARFTRTDLGRRLPLRWQPLVSTLERVLVVRIDESTIELVSPYGLLGFSAAGFSDQLQSMRSNATFHTPLFDCTVLRVSEHGPTRIRVRFIRPMEASSWIFLQSTPRGLRRMTIPPVGRAVQLPSLLEQER